MMSLSTVNVLSSVASVAGGDQDPDRVRALTLMPLRRHEATHKEPVLPLAPTTAIGLVSLPIEPPAAAAAAAFLGSHTPAAVTPAAANTSRRDENCC